MFTTTIEFPCTVQSAAEVHRSRLQISGSQKTMYFMPFCMYVIHHLCCELAHCIVVCAIAHKHAPAGAAITSHNGLIQIHRLIQHLSVLVIDVDLMWPFTLGPRKSNKTSCMLSLLQEPSLCKSDLLHWVSHASVAVNTCYLL